MNIFPVMDTRSSLSLKISVFIAIALLVLGILAIPAV
jgi:hypothetical protein